MQWLIGALKAYFRLMLALAGVQGWIILACWAIAWGVEFHQAGMERLDRYRSSHRE